MQLAQPNDNLVGFPDTTSEPQIRVAGDDAIACLMSRRDVYLDTALVIAAEIAPLWLGGELRCTLETKQARALASLRVMA